MRLFPSLNRIDKLLSLRGIMVFVGLFIFQLNICAQNIIAPYELEKEFRILLNDSVQSAVNSSIRPLEFPYWETDTSPRLSFFKRVINDQPLFSSSNENARFVFNPVISFQAGKAKGSQDDKSTYLSSRGFRLAAELGKQWQVDVSFVENQAKYPGFIDSFARANGNILPSFGLARKYKETGYDYSYTNGLVRWMPSKKFSGTLGYGQLFLGEGYRSMFLSDNSFNYPYLQLNLKLPKLHYMVLFSQYINTFRSYAGSHQRKWSASNYLNLSLTSKLQVGMFQGVTWLDSDVEGKRGFDVLYLVPFTVLHPIAFSQYSADNTFVGLHGKYQLRKNIVSYFQLFIDDLNIQETLKNKKQHINNKYAFQLGIKAFHRIPKGIMRTRLEYNYSRPYTYGHRKIELSHTHYQQALAHPLGANFHEAIFTSDIKYKRWYSEFSGQYAVVGRKDNGSFPVGNDLFGGEANVPSLGTVTLQGRKENLLTMNANVGYILNKSWRTSLQAGVFYKRSGFEDNSSGNLTWFQVGIVTKLRNQYFDY